LDFSSELRFEHYQVLKNKDGTSVELGRGAMGITYKALDVHLQRPVALKIINGRFIGDDLARRRFVREARAAASVRHPNVASVFHLGESSGNYFYAMEFVDGETLGKLIQRSGRAEPDVALEVVAQVAAGLMAIEKQHLVHRDIKASNIMVNWDDRQLENVKIIDLGLAKGIAEETISTGGGFIGTPGYASPEQFAGIGIDIRSDLYSLGITLWEMLSGKLPFQGSATELMRQHQHAAPPIEKLRDVPAPIIAVLEILPAKDPGQRFQSPAQLQKALIRVREAIGSGSRLEANNLRSICDQKTERSLRRKPKKLSRRWLIGSSLCLFGLVAGWFYFFGNEKSFFNRKSVERTPTEKSIVTRA
jgi:serine/threonine protein kinase